VRDTETLCNIDNPSLPHGSDKLINHLNVVLRKLLSSGNPGFSVRLGRCAATRSLIR
jgi:hypothetical protein